jgi:hypothetical protein
MKTHGHRITAFDDSLWGGWPATEYGKTGKAFRRMRSGQKHSIRIPSQSGDEQLAVLCLAEPPSADPSKHWRASISGQPAKLHCRKSFPKHLLLELPESGNGDHTELLFEPTGSAKEGNDLLIEEAAIMPRNGRFSELWTSPWRALKKLTSKQSLPWAPADFPYSHFDGLGYLLEHDEVRQAVLSRKYDTAFRYWYTKGRHLGHPLPLAVHREPLPGTPFNLVMHYTHTCATAPNQNSVTSHRSCSNCTLLEEELLEAQIDVEKAAIENAEVKTKMEKLQRHSESCEAELEELRSTNSAYADKQTAIEHELSKAEGQLEMLKELLLQPHSKVPRTSSQGGSIK